MTSRLAATSKPSALMVVSSSCQLYSGTGTALFDWIRLGRRAVDFSFLIDTGDRRNFKIAKDFCDGTGIPFFPSAPNPKPGCPDNGALDVASVIRGRDWDFIECVSWANAATNLDVLSSRAPQTRLLFTPHTQPLWTLGGASRYFMVPIVLAEMLRHSDAIFMDSPRELELQGKEEGRTKHIFIPLGVDTERFHFARTEVEHTIFCVCDFREHRKRPDILFRGFSMARENDKSLSLTIAGTGSMEIAIPAPLQPYVRRLGYVPLEDLIQQYRSSKAVVLLSDYEAFGLPIAEALCCGTPVVINRQPELVDIFSGLDGVHFAVNSDSTQVKNVLLDAVGRDHDRPSIARAATERFSLATTYGRKLAHVLRLRD